MKLSREYVITWQCKELKDKLGKTKCNSFALYIYIFFLSFDSSLMFCNRMCIYFDIH